MSIQQINTFAPEDNQRKFAYLSVHEGRLEFPLSDPGSGTPDEGILWLDSPLRISGHTYHWIYVKPIDVIRAD